MSRVGAPGTGCSGAPLQPSPAADALVATGDVSQAASRSFAEAGAVHLLDGFPFVAGVWEHPLDGAAELYLPYLHPRLRSDGVLFRRTIAAAFNAVRPDVDLVVLRLPPEDQPPARMGFFRRGRYIRKSPSATVPLPGCEFAVRDPAGGELPAICELFAQGLSRAMTLQGRSTTLAVAQGFAEAQLTTSERSQRCVVAVTHGSVVGYALWETNARDELTGEHYHELIDVDAVPAYRGAGVIQGLTAAVESIVAEDSATLVGHVTGQLDGGDEQIYERLLAAGWSPEYTLWQASRVDVAVAS